MDTDRFNHNVDRKVKTEAPRVQRVEVITGVERRRDWTDSDKLAIIAESCQEGVVISDVARRHGLRPQQLFTWRNEFRRREAARVQQSRIPGFAPVMITQDRAAAVPVSGTGTVPIEIVLGGVTVRLHGRVEAETLAAVLRAVKAAT